MPPGMYLGESRRIHRPGRRVVVEPPAPRPNVIDEGVEYEVIWHCHRDALSLLPPWGTPMGHHDHTQVRGEVVALSARTPRWRFLP